MKFSCRERGSSHEQPPLAPPPCGTGLFESAALRDLSIHLLWLRSNAPNNTPFLFYSTSLSLCRVAQQNYVPNDNYQSKLWSEKWRQRKLLTRTSSRNRTPKRRSVIREGGEREQGADLHPCRKTPESRTFRKHVGSAPDELPNMMNIREAAAAICDLKQ